jgi:hypothetical protein
MHLTLGILRLFKLDGFPPSAPAPMTQAVIFNNLICYRLSISRP